MSYGMMQIMIQCKICMTRMIMDGDIDDVEIRPNLVRIRAYCPKCSGKE